MERPKKKKRKKELWVVIICPVTRGCCRLYSHRKEANSPTGPFWLVKRTLRLVPSVLAMLMLSPSVQYSFLMEAHTKIWYTTGREREKFYYITIKLVEPTVVVRHQKPQSMNNSNIIDKKWEHLVCERHRTARELIWTFLKRNLLFSFQSQNRINRL